MAALAPVRVIVVDADAGGGQSGVGDGGCQAGGYEGGGSEGGAYDGGRYEGGGYEGDLGDARRWDFARLVRTHALDLYNRAENGVDFWTLADAPPGDEASDLQFWGRFPRRLTPRSGALAAEIDEAARGAAGERGDGAAHRLALICVLPFEALAAALTSPGAARSDDQARPDDPALPEPTQEGAVAGVSDPAGGRYEPEGGKRPRFDRARGATPPAVLDVLDAIESAHAQLSGRLQTRLWVSLVFRRGAGEDGVGAIAEDVRAAARAHNAFFLSDPTRRDGGQTIDARHFHKLRFLIDAARSVPADDDAEREMVDAWRRLRPTLDGGASVGKIRWITDADAQGAPRASDTLSAAFWAWRETGSMPQDQADELQRTALKLIGDFDAGLSETRQELDRRIDQEAAARDAVEGVRRVPPPESLRPEPGRRSLAVFFDRRRAGAIGERRTAFEAALRDTHHVRQHAVVEMFRQQAADFEKTRADFEGQIDLLMRNLNSVTGRDQERANELALRFRDAARWREELAVRERSELADAFRADTAIDEEEAQSLRLEGLQSYADYGRHVEEAQTQARSMARFWPLLAITLALSLSLYLLALTVLFSEPQLPGDWIDRLTLAQLPEYRWIMIFSVAAFALGGVFYSLRCARRYANALTAASAAADELTQRVKSIAGIAYRRRQARRQARVFYEAHARIQPLLERRERQIFDNEFDLWQVGAAQTEHPRIDQERARLTDLDSGPISKRVRTALARWRPSALSGRYRIDDPGGVEAFEFPNALGVDVVVRMADPSRPAGSVA